MRTDRLFLRPAWPDDARELAALLDHDGAGVMANIAASESLCDGPGTQDLPRLLITLPSSGGATAIGAIGLTRGEGKLRLGYWLSRAHWGHGYAAEAARGMLAFARTLGAARVYARQWIDDQASLLVLTRAGFRPTGEQHQEHGRLAAVYVADFGTMRDGGGSVQEVRAA